MPHFDKILAEDAFLQIQEPCFWDLNQCKEYFGSFNFDDDPILVEMFDKELEHYMLTKKLNISIDIDGVTKFRDDMPKVGSKRSRDDIYREEIVYKPDVDTLAEMAHFNPKLRR